MSSVPKNNIDYTPVNMEDPDEKSSATEQRNNKMNKNDNDKIEKIQQHVNEVSDIMQMNIDKILQRGTNLENLEDRSQHLSEYSTEFRAGARRVQRTMWWKNMKLNIIIGLVVAIVIIIIIVSLTSK